MSLSWSQNSQVQMPDMPQAQWNSEAANIISLIHSFIQWLLFCIYVTMVGLIAIVVITLNFDPPHKPKEDTLQKK